MSTIPLSHFLTHPSYLFFTATFHIFSLPYFLLLLAIFSSFLMCLWNSHFLTHSYHHLYTSQCHSFVSQIPTPTFSLSLLSPFLCHISYLYPAIFPHSLSTARYTEEEEAIHCQSAGERDEGVEFFLFYKSNHLASGSGTFQLPMLFLICVASAAAP